MENSDNMSPHSDRVLLYLILLLAGVLLLLSGCTTGQPDGSVPATTAAPVPVTESPRTLTWYTEQNPPFNYRENGTLRGIGVDLLEAVTERMGENVSREQVHLVPWTDGYTAVQSGPRTVLFTTARLPARESLFKWAGPIYPYNNVLFARADRDITISGPEDLEKYRIGVITDDIAGLLILESGVNKSRLVQQTNASVLAGMLENGEIDLWGCVETAGRYFVRQQRGDDSSLRVVYRLPELQGYYAFSRDVPDATVQSFQKALDGLRSDKEQGFSRYEQIVHRYAEPACGRQSFSDAAVMNLVNRTVAAMEMDAPDTLRRINARESPYRDPLDPSLYVFVFDSNGTIVAQPDNPRLVGVNLMGKPDVTGNLFRDRMMAGALQNGTGWEAHVYSNPSETGLYYKNAFYRLARGSDGTAYVVASVNVKACGT